MPAGVGMSGASAPWLAASKARIFFDMHLPSWPGKGIAEKLAPREIGDAIAASGADSAVLFAKCQYGNFYTRVAGESLHPGLGGADFLAETAAALREKGVRTLAYYSVSWDERHADEHPEWLACDASGSPAAVGPGKSRWRTLCINSPYADLVDAHMREIARKGIDGIWLDMTIVGEGNCYCPRCRAAFAARHGGEIPLSAADPSWPAFLQFRCDMVEALYARLRASIRSVAPGLSFTNNYWGYPWTSGEMGSRAVGATRSVDFLTGEAYADWTGIRSSSLLPIFLRSVAAGRPFESLIGTAVNTWDYTPKPAAYLAYEACAVFAHGATVTVDDQPYHDGSFDTALYRGELREIFGDISRARRTVEGRHARYAAVYHSQQTKDQCRSQQDFVRDVCGGFRLLRDLHLPVEFLFDETETLPGAAEVPVVVLPGVTALSGGEWRRLQRYMEGGGLVIAAGGIGGDPETVRALAELGVHVGSPSPFSLSYFRPSGPLLSAASGRDVLVRGRFVTCRPGPALPAGAAQGEIVEPICETGPREFFHNNLPAPHRATGLPALFEVPVGAGALALFPQPLFRHYAKEPSAAVRRAVGALVGGRCRPPRIGLTLPMKMDFATVEGDGTIFVHLLNPNVEPSLCCGMMDIYEGRFERSYEYMEETVPVHDLRILVRRDRVAGAKTLRESSPVEMRAVPEGWEIRVDRVALWEIVEIDLGPGEWTTTGEGPWR